MNIRYRLRQLWHNLTAGPLTPAAADGVAALLSEKEEALFGRMSASDQWHAYRVCCELQEQGETDPDLLAASLLHDVGKVRVKLSAWDRTIAVLGEAIAPSKVEAWGRGEPVGWKRPFVVRRRHASWGAEMAREAGSRPAVIELIALHQEAVPSGAGEASPLALLQWADDQN